MLQQEPLTSTGSGPHIFSTDPADSEKIGTITPAWRWWIPRWEWTTCCSCNASCCTTEYTGDIPSGPGRHSRTPGGLHSDRRQFPALSIPMGTAHAPALPPAYLPHRRRRNSRRARPAFTQPDSPPAMGPSMPSDIDPQSGFRLPLPKREDLDEAGKAHYDRATAPGASIAGLQGPTGIGLYSPKASAHARALNRYLRFEAGFAPRVREIAILTTAREMDSQFEWSAHEPEALKEGVEPRVIDVIKRRLTTAGLDETDATVIELGRQIFRDHKVTPETFAKAKALFGPNKLVELVMLMGNYAGTAALLTAVDMQLHAGQKPLLPIP